MPSENDEQITLEHETDALLRLTDFSFRFGRRRIVRDVSFSVRRGRFVAMIGPNGAGKSTLIRCIVRILTGGNGAIELCGRPIEEYSQREIAQRVAYVPQPSDLGAIPFTVRRFVEMARYAHGEPFSLAGDEDRRAVDEALHSTGTLGLCHRRVDTLSGGERQKVQIAAALAQSPELLLLDEPTGPLDYRGQAEILALLGRISHREGMTVLAVTHDVNHAALFADRVVALRDGEAVFVGPPDKLMKADVLRRIYDTALQLTDHPQADVPIVIPRPPVESPPEDASP